VINADKGKGNGSRKSARKREGIIKKSTRAVDAQRGVRSDRIG